MNLTSTYAFLRVLKKKQLGRESEEKKKRSARIGKYRLFKYGSVPMAGKFEGRKHRPFDKANLHLSSVTVERCRELSSMSF